MHDISNALLSKRNALAQNSYNPLQCTFTTYGKRSLNKIVGWVFIPLICSEKEGMAPLSYIIVRPGPAWRVYPCPTNKVIYRVDLITMVSKYQTKK